MIFAFHKSLIINGIIRQTVFGYFDLYFVLNIIIKSDMETKQKIAKNLTNENIFPLKVSSLRKYG